MTGSSFNTGSSKVDSIYDLFGIVSHSGSLDGGHYIAFCKNHANEKWYEFNDSVTREVTEKEVASQEAYLLFYSLKSTKHQEEVTKIKTLIENNKDKSQSVYVTKTWFNTWEILSKKNVNPIENEYACPHKKLVPNYVVNSHLFMPVPLSVWESWIENYGGGPILQELEICGLCKIEMELLEKRKRKEHEQVNLFDSSPGLRTITCI
eukprot:TRINITY_DN17184_c0_g1_i1.p1 TRINITY_DN17184_c0_g1~~TRINITY_DN17184_c0_g1_i1.p1  ORF type:complete len:207 (-),score=55.87 TRINITY_DN17184_c0_g1_i1:175-795(-)